MSSEIIARDMDGARVSIGDRLTDATTGFTFTVSRIDVMDCGDFSTATVTDEHYLAHDLAKCSVNSVEPTEFETAVEELAFFLWQQTAFTPEQARKRAEYFAEKVRNTQ